MLQGVDGRPMRNSAIRSRWRCSTSQTARRLDGFEAGRCRIQRRSAADGVFDAAHSCSRWQDERAGDAARCGVSWASPATLTKPLAGCTTSSSRSSAGPISGARPREEPAALVDAPTRYARDAGV